MTGKFDKNNNLESSEAEALISDNYAANLNDDQKLYKVPQSHTYIKFWSFLILVILSSNRV